jgi:hypothetical protein
MQLHSIDKLHVVAKFTLEDLHSSISRAERLEHWAKALEREPKRILTALPGTEHMSIESRDLARSANSPISVAYDEPLLRLHGLRDDTYGEAKRFFELSDSSLHSIVCHCHIGPTMRGDQAARFVRRAIRGDLFDRIGAVLGRWWA